MRRQEREITDQSLIESILKRATVCRIGLSENDIPYVVPVFFGYRDNCLYFHSAPAGKKMDILRKNNNVCFEVDIDVELLASAAPCRWSARYLSVIGFGKAQFIHDPEGKREALNVIMEHYAGRSYEYAEDAIDTVAVIKVEIHTMTGKRSGYA